MQPQPFSHPVLAVNDGLFNSATGKIIDIHNPTLEMFCIEDISAALSKICRFGGHCRDFYSVAEHSVLVAALAPQDCKLEALMHDATEAYLGDVIKPLKVILGESYGAIEDRFTDCISKRYGLDPEKLERIKQYDMQALELEFEFLLQDNVPKWKAIMKKLELNHLPLLPKYADYLFQVEYRRIMTNTLGPAALV